MQAIQNWEESCMGCTAARDFSRFSCVPPRLFLCPLAENTDSLSYHSTIVSILPSVWNQAVIIFSSADLKMWRIPWAKQHSLQWPNWGEYEGNLLFNGPFSYRTGSAEKTKTSLSHTILNRIKFLNFIPHTHTFYIFQNVYLYASSCLFAKNMIWSIAKREATHWKIYWKTKCKVLKTCKGCSVPQRYVTFKSLCELWR